MIWLTPQTKLPPPSTADADGIVALGNDLRMERLLEAYSSGIFPWPMGATVIPWVSPDPRMLLFADALRVPRSLQKRLRNGGFSVTFDTCFDQVMLGCATAKRAGQAGTWITQAMRRAYGELHRAGWAHSVEVWQGGALVGGLYGVSIGAMFCGESMFFRVPDASKVALVALVHQTRAWGFRFVDCQVYTEHTASMGAEEWPRERYLGLLRLAVVEPSRRGVWESQIDVSALYPAGTAGP
jgi:leucyl/phenylalanyl-tRNA--protein transferase